MPQAIKTYETITTLQDEQDGLLNLAWTLDERELLSADLTAIIAEQLQDEVRNALQYLHSYFVKDPYGEGLLAPAIAQYFSLPSSCAVTCGAGVISILSSLARLCTGKTALIIGDVYTDFPYWLEQSNANCVSGTVEGIAIHKPRIVFLERPSLIGDITEVQLICDEAAKHDAIVIIDESNANYYPPSFSAINTVQDVVVIRGFSKAYSLGGLRLAYCISPAHLNDRIREAIPPLLPSSLSLKLGKKILEQGDVAMKLRQTIKENKIKMKKLLEEAGFTGLVVSSEYLPYIFIRENTRLLEQKGIMGKPHPVWHGPGNIEVIYRLSVPLRPARMELFQKKIHSSA